MSKPLDSLIDAATVAAALCAIGVAAFVGWQRSAQTANGGHPEPQTISDWRQYAVGHRLGPEDAIATIVEFGDYQCPACRSIEPMVRRFRQQYPDEVALIYRHWPLPQHPLAYPAARAAECAARQGLFAEYHQALYDSSYWIADPNGAFIQLAEHVGVVDMKAFRECVSDPTPVASIEEDIDAAKQLGAAGTPTFLINGVMRGAFPDSTEWADIVDRARNGS